MTIIPLVTNFDLTRIPVEGTPTFRSDATYAWNTIPTVITELDASITATNAVAGEIAALATQTQNDSLSAAASALVSNSNALYKGDWVAGYATTGYSLGMSVTFTDGYRYVSKIDNNLATPVTLTNDANWDFIEAVSPINPVFTGSITEQTATMPALALDPANGTIQTLTMTADSTFTENLLDGQYLFFELTNGGFTADWITSMTVVWIDGKIPILSTTALLMFYKSSNILKGALVGSIV